MSESEIFDRLLQASPSVIWALVVFALVWRASVIASGAKAWQDSRNEGEKVRAQREALSSEASTKVIEIAVRSMQEFQQAAAKVMQEFQQQSRDYYNKRQDEIQATVRLLEGEIQELKDQIEDKDERITELERENESLKAEIEVLRKRMNGTAKKAAPRKKAA